MAQFITVLSGLIAVLITAFGAFFGWWQVRIAREKLKHDLFDKRWHLYDRLCSITTSLGFRNENLTEDAYDDCLELLAELNGLCRKARFLFSPKAQVCFGLQRINLESLVEQYARISGIYHFSSKETSNSEPVEQLRSKVAQISLNLQDEAEKYLVLGDFTETPK